MKNILLFLLMSMSTSAFAQQWERIADSKGTTLYVDMYEVKKESNIVRILFDYQEAQRFNKGDPFLSMIIRGTLDCTSRTTELTSIAHYSKSMAGGNLRQIGISREFARVIGGLDPIVANLHCNGNTSQNSNFRKNQVSSPDFEKKIRLIYARRYPNDFSMQKTLIEDQLNSYNHMQRWKSEPQVPQNIFDNLKNQYAKRYPDDYSMQKTLLEDQIKSYLALRK